MYASVTTGLVLPKGAVYDGQKIYDDGIEVSLASERIPVLYNHNPSLRIGEVLDVFEKSDGLYAVLAVYEEYKDKIQCNDLVCRGADGWSIGGFLDGNRLMIEEISLTPTPYFEETFKNVEVVLANRHMVRACGCGKPIKPENGIITNMKVAAQETVDQMLADMIELAAKVEALSNEIAALKASMDGMEQRVAALEAMVQTMPESLEAVKASMNTFLKDADGKLASFINATADLMRQMQPLIAGATQKVKGVAI